MRIFYNKFAAIPIILMVLLSVQSTAQLALDTTVTALELANEIVGPGVTVSNVTLNSPSMGAGIFSNGNTTSIGMSNGILLTTGDAYDAIGPNVAGNTSKDKPDFTDDTDIDALTTYSIKDQCILEFDFVAQSNQILVQYVFASEEYNEWVCTQYNDLFGFFVSGPNPGGGNYSGTNVALVPGTALPVSINTINNGTAGSNGNSSICESLSYSNYYVYNQNGATIGYDGYTVLLTGMIAIVPGQTYHFKFAIADISDGLWDSGIFIRADSFSIFNCQAGNISFAATPVVMCSEDNVADIIDANTSSIAPSDTYNFILTNSSGQILAVNQTGVFDLALFGVGTFSVYGISYDGIVNNLTVGSNISAISVTGNTGCFELTAPLSASRVNCTPVLDCPDNVTVSCLGSVPSPNISSVAVVYQLCPGGTVSWLNDAPTGSACSGTIIRTYQFTDGCGHSALCQQTITYNDNTTPVIAGLPTSANISCNATMPIGSNYAVTATDFCDASVAITSTFTDNNVGCNVARTITWTATDDCGNVATASRTFTSQDNIAPQLIGVPTNATMQCGEAVPAAVVSAIDNCDTEPNVSLSATTVDNACGYSFIRTWTATDACGNSVSASQTTTFFDNIDPVLAGLPTNATVLCGQLPTAASFNVTATDACDDEVTITSSFSDAGSGCNIVRTITWTATDDCGNDVSASRTFTTSDDIDPVFTNLPNNGDVLCGGLPSSTQYNVTASDNCDQDVAITVDAVDVGAGCNVQRTITWTATDDCGNSVSASRTFTTQDNIAPQLIGVPTNATMQCGEAVPAAVVSAIDNCDTEPNVSLSATTVDNACGYSFIRTWTATDACGNSVSASQTTTFIDTTAPTLTGVPANAMVECSDIPAAPEVIASDNCDSELDVLFDESEIVLNSCTYQINRTWTTQDACGNSTSITQLLVVQDTTVPEILTAPLSEITLECANQELPVPPTFNDNCDEELNIEFISGISNSNNCGYDIERSWIASDNCGNSTIFTQIVHVLDTTQPTLQNVPISTTVDCSAIPAPAVVTAIDNCDTTLAVAFAEAEDASECGKIITRTWTVSDDCGNITSATQMITAVDSNSPQVISEPADATYDCSDVIPNIQPLFIDECDTQLTVVATSENENVGCNYLIHKTWTATDDCGNSTVVYQDITIVDNTPPVLLSAPASATVQCSSLLDAPAVIAQDNCDDDVNLEYTETQSSDCPYVITRTWTATDDCGNQTSHTQLLTVIDTEAPQLIGVPANATIQCGQPMPSAMVQAIDNCTEEPTLSLSVNTIDYECGSIMTRTWSASDACGNITTQTQTINITDNTAPILLGVPANTSANCENIPTEALVTATDNCTNEIIVEFSEVVGQGCPYIITRTWNAVDGCGNAASQSQVIMVVDVTPPSFVNFPGNITINCVGTIPPATLVEATDNCDDNVVVTVTDILSDGDCGSLQRTYTATDNCGNEITGTQIINVVDQTAPQIFNIPDDMTMECSDTPPAYSSDVNATDNCDNAPVITVNDVIVHHDCWHQIYRSYIATDNCGNQDSAVQVIYVLDETAPVFASHPTDLTVSCSSIPSPPELSATDNCDNTISYEYSEIASSSGCPSQIKRIWTATDDCGNTATAVQILTVVDEEAPVFDPFAVFAQVACDQVASYTLAAHDNCDAQVEVNIIDELMLEGGCYGTIQRIYEAVDNCGNTTTAMQMIEIIDLVAPVLNNIPDDLSIDCSQNVPAPAEDIYATDNCSEGIEITFSQTQSAEFCPYDIVRTWSTTDLCGNTTSATQTIHVTVNISPIVHLKAYPNPSTIGQLRIQFSIPKNAEVSAIIFDAYGRQNKVLLDKTAEGGVLYEWTLVGDKVTPGTYTLRVMVSGEMYIERFTIIGD